MREISVQLYSLIEKLKGFIAFINGDMNKGIKEFDKFTSSILNIVAGMPVPKNYLDAAWAAFNGYLHFLRKKIKYLVKNKQLQKIKLGKYGRFVNEFAAIVVIVKKEYLKVILEEFSYGGYRVVVVEKDRNIASITQFSRGEKPIITISIIVAPKLRIPIIEHEIAEFEYKTGYGYGGGNAHEVAGIPAGRKKAAELGVLKQFLAFEKKVSGKF